MATPEGAGADVSLVALAACLVPTAYAAADNGVLPGVDAQEFRPSPDGATTLWADDSHIGGPGFAMRSLLSYARDPLGYRYDGGGTATLVSDVMQEDLIPELRYGRMRVALDLPIYAAAYTANSFATLGLGDFRLDGRIVAHAAEDGGFGFAVDAALGLPTGTDTGLRSGGVSWDGHVIVDRLFGPLRVVGNTGARGGPARELTGITLENYATARVAGSYAFTPSAGVALEAYASTPLTEPIISPGALAAEWTGGGWYRRRELVVRAGVGTGLTHGIGAPDYRVIVGFGWERDGLADRDGDGVPDRADRCVVDPGPRGSSTGCPEPDNGDKPESR